MADLLADWWVHSTSVERRTGQGPTGPTYDPPVAVLGFVDQKTRLIRDSAGTEVVSSSTVYYPPGTAAIPVGSYVTEPASMGGRRAKVITCAMHDAGTLDTPNHVEVTLE